MVFLGDSVTAGFGFFGQKENAKNITGTVNNPFPSSWNLGDNALSDCSPGDGNPDRPMQQQQLQRRALECGPVEGRTQGAQRRVLYQIAGSQDPGNAAPVENWAVTGSTPAQWDTGGPFNSQLNTIRTPMWS